MGKLDHDKLNEIIERTMRKYRCPALSIAVIEQGKTTLQRGYGTREMGKEETVDANTSYAIASMSKSTVSTALAMLHEQKLFDWDDRVTRFLPDFRFYDPFASTEIRVIDLLIHNSGLHSESGGTIWYGSDYTREEVVRRLRFLRPLNSFRSQYAYQNVCYLVAGMLIEKICGMSWDDFVQEQIFSPLGMTRTFPTMCSRDAARIDNIAAPYAQIEGKLTQIPYRNHDNVGPAASVHSTAADLARYLHLFLSGGMAGSARLLSAESINFLHQPHILVPQEPLEKHSHPRLYTRLSAYGLGWTVQDYDGWRRIGHSGGVDGMRCRMEMLPELNAGAVVLTNFEDRRVYLSVLYSVLDMLCGLEPVDWAETLENDVDAPQDINISERISGTHPSLMPAEYSGVYQDSVYGDILVENNDGALMLRFSHTPAFTADLSRWHYDTFQLHWRDRYIPDGMITFQLNASGAVKSFHLDQPRLLDVDFTELDEYIRKK